MPDWNRKLSRELKTREETILRTLDDARRYALKLPQYLQDQNQWKLKAAGALLAAADGGDIEAATEAVDDAMFLSARKWFKPVPEGTRSKPLAVLKRR